MQHQRGPKPRDEHGALLTPIPCSISKDPSKGPPEERAAENWPVGSHLRSSDRWEDEEPSPDESVISRGSVHSVPWEDEVVTARRSVPRLHSAPWDPVHSEELIPTLPPPPAEPARQQPPAARASPRTPAAAMVPSVGPVALEADGEEDDEAIDFRRGPMRRGGGLLAGLLATAAALAVVVYGGALGHQARHQSLRPILAAPHPHSESLLPSPPRAEENSASDSQSSAVKPPLDDPATNAPPPETGTIVGSPEHRLYVDGRLAASWRIDVKCGKHTVKNGSQGTVRTVDVPCGGEIEVSP
jgi:hypothetical protein